MVIVDEAHHLPAPQWQQIVRKFRPHAKVVFFTASPTRSDGKEITADGTLSVGPGFAYILTPEEAIRDRLIRKVEFKVISHDDPVLSVLVAIQKCMQEKNPLPGQFRHAAIIITQDIMQATQVESLCTKAGFNNQTVLVLHNQIRSKVERIQDIRDGRYSGRI